MIDIQKGVFDNTAIINSLARISLLNLITRIDKHREYKSDLYCEYDEIDIIEFDNFRNTETSIKYLCGEIYHYVNGTGTDPSISATTCRTIYKYVYEVWGTYRDITLTRNVFSALHDYLNFVGSEDLDTMTKRPLRPDSRPPTSVKKVVVFQEWDDIVALYNAQAEHYRCVLWRCIFNAPNTIATQMTFTSLWQGKVNVSEATAPIDYYEAIKNNIKELFKTEGRQLEKYVFPEDESEDPGTEEQRDNSSDRETLPRAVSAQG